MMGFAYFWQFLDKMVLSQTTLFGLREDLVSYLHQFLLQLVITINRTCVGRSTRGPRGFSTSDTSSGIGPIHTSWFDFPLGNTSHVQCKHLIRRIRNVS